MEPPSTLVNHLVFRQLISNPCIYCELNPFCRVIVNCYLLIPPDDRELEGRVVWCPFPLSALNGALR